MTATRKMTRSVSCDSFFKYIPQRLFISSYGKFLSYCAQNNIITSRGIRKMALLLYFNRV